MTNAFVAKRCHTEGIQHLSNCDVTVQQMLVRPLSLQTECSILCVKNTCHCSTLLFLSVNTELLLEYQ